MQSDKSTEKLQDILLAFNAITEKIVEHEEELEELLRAILVLAVPVFNVSYASILLLDEEKKQFHIVSTYGEPPFDSDLDTILDVSKLMKRPASTDQKHVLTEIIDDSERSRLKPEEKRFLGDVLCSPLVIQRKVTGVACIYGEHLHRGIFESNELSLWAGLASLAIEKSRLNNQIHKRLEITSDELRRTESQLIRSEKLNSLMEMAMSVAHVIRNPVTVIGGLSRRINRSLSKNDPRREWSEIILSEASRLESIVKEFERFFLINQISFQIEDVNRLVKQAADDFVSQYQTKKSLTLKRSLDSKPLMCHVDIDLFKRCLIHLLTNAYEASKDGIQITLTTYRADDEAIIEVADSGKGMSRKQMGDVFEPFYTTKGQGAGMGLTFVHFVITEHSGQVEISSEKDAGTRFRIRLPLESAKRGG